MTTEEANTASAWSVVDFNGGEVDDDRAECLDNGA